MPVTVLLMASLVLGSCGGPTEPEGPQVPDVAGVYAGDVTYRFSLLSDLTITSRMRMDVAQSGAQLTITGTETLFGETDALPALTGEINETGFFTITGGGSAGSYRDPDCGQVTTTSSSIVFSGRNLRLQQTSSTDNCGSLSLNGLLVREG